MGASLARWLDLEGTVEPVEETVEPVEEKEKETIEIPPYVQPQPRAGESPWIGKTPDYVRAELVALGDTREVREIHPRKPNQYYSMVYEHYEGISVDVDKHGYITQVYH
jgi:hypothetical protein